MGLRDAAHVDVFEKKYCLHYAPSDGAASLQPKNVNTISETEQAKAPIPLPGI